MGKFNTMLYFSISSLIVLLIITYVYFHKKRINSTETKLYSNLIVVTIIALILEIISGLIFYPNFIQLRFFIKKLFMITILVWESIVLHYSIYISNLDKGKKYNKAVQKKFTIITTILLIIVSSLILCSTLSANMDNNGKILNTYGPSQSIFTSAAVFLILTILGVLIKNIKKLKNKKYTPIIFFVITIIIESWLQILFPQFLMVNYVLALTVILMYFTIENPDLKLLKEVSESKEISDNANEEKTLFLYNITQEIRKSFGNIDESADNIIDCKKIEIAQDEARNIKAKTSKFRTEMKDILDVSSIDSSNIKVYNKAYNIKTILKTVISNYNTICKNKNLEFRSNIEHNLPERLYGDSINLKNVLSKTLAYCVKNTNSGFIELDLNTVIKNDICRLIITLEDSSVGIKSEELENIKINDSLISEAYKTIILMNGAMILTSNYGVGTKIKIVLDQKIDTSEHEENNYTEIFDNKKILVIDDNESSIKIIEKLVKDANVIVDSSMTGRDAINKIKTKNRYDLILLDENLNQVSGKELLQKLQKFRNFNIPVILLSKDNKYEYNLEYEEEGFSDILIKPISKEKLMKIIDKHTKKDNNDIF